MSWCRGSLGTARAVVLAGQALGRPEWTRAAMDMVQAIHARPAASWGIRDNTLCHGWAGALHQLCRFSWDSTAPSLPPAAHDAAHHLIGSYQADAPFCYQYRHPGTGQMLNLPGLPEGATGIALALRSYAIGQPPASDPALLPG